jgi:hypothetical protein
MGKRKEIEWYVDDNGCHVCTSHTRTKAGYSVMRRNKKNIYIHRYMYEKYKGEIPKGMVIRHKCDNPNCINPEHLEVGTHRDNVNDKISRGRQLKGEQIGNSKLTEEIVIEIYRSNLSYKELQNKYNVSNAMVSLIKNKKRWQHLLEGE